MKYPNEDKYDHLFKANGLTFHWHWLFLKAQVKQESQFKPNAFNKRSKAAGLSQFIPSTWNEWGRGNVYDPVENLLAQAKYMSWIRKVVMKLTDKDILAWTLSAYNWGIGHVMKLLKENIKFEDAQLPNETSTYVKLITDYYEEYIRENYPDFDFENLSPIDAQVVQRLNKAPLLVNVQSKTKR